MTSTDGEVRAMRRKHSVDPEPDHEEDERDDGHEHERVHLQHGVREPREIGAEHQELAVRDVHDAHQPVLQVEADGDHGIDATGDQAGRGEFEPESHAAGADATTAPRSPAEPSE